MVQQRYWGLLQTHTVIFKLDSGIFHVCPALCCSITTAKLLDPFLRVTTYTLLLVGQGGSCYSAVHKASIRPPQQPSPPSQACSVRCQSAVLLPKHAARWKAAHISLQTSLTHILRPSTRPSPHGECSASQTPLFPAFGGILGESRSGGSSVYLSR